jgi:putative mRNA 3-end processing factor
VNDLLRPTERGLACAVGDFVIDPVVPCPVAVITHAHADHARPTNGIVHAAAEGERLLRLRVGPEATIVAHPYGERFRLGDAIVSLHPAGHIRGSSQVRVEIDGERWVVSGDYKRDADPTCTPFEVVPCDVFVTEATFALPIYRWPSTAEVAADVFAWWQRNATLGRASLLCCYALGKTQRLLAALRAHTEQSALLHGAMLKLTEAYRDDGVPLLATEHASVERLRNRAAGELVLAPPSASRTPWMRNLGTVETAFASGWMRVRGVRRGRGWDRGFVLSDHADWPSLLATIAATQARRVLVTHGRSDLLVRWLREQNIDAAPLGGGRERNEGDDG